jgi:hypothetical protein
MKRIFLLAMLTFFGIVNSNAQQVKKSTTKKAPITKTKKAVVSKVDDAKAVTAIGAKLEGAGMLFENETIDYGTIPHNADGNREFVFTNNGSKPLIITNATGSCGCTVPTSPKEPIAPGAKGKIGVKYATDRVGAFTKTVTVSSNAEGQATKTLTIKGTVLADEKPASTPTTKS